MKTGPSSDSIRIGIDLVSERGVPGGIHTYTNRLMEAMVELVPLCGDLLGQALELVLLQNDDYQWLFPVESHSSIRLVKTGRRGLGAARRRLLQQTLVPRLALREGLHLVHSVNNVLPLRMPMPTVVTVHDLSPFALPGRFHFLKRSFLRWAVPRSVRRASGVITDSEAIREEILCRLPDVEPGRISVAGAAADPQFHPRRDPRTEERLRRQYNLPGEFLLSVGAADPGKNLEGVATALEILHEREQLSPQWVIAGTGGRTGNALERSLRRRSIASQVRTLGIVSLSDLPHLYRMASIFLFPSFYEGFGLPVLEALACGTPTITSNCSSMPEVAGEAALKVDPRRPEDLARAIHRLLFCPDLRANLAHLGPLRASEFSWKETARRTLLLYRDALERDAAMQRKVLQQEHRVTTSPRS